MNFSLSEQDTEIRQLAQKFFGTECPLLQRASHEELSRDLYRKMGDVGLFGIMVPEIRGGSAGTRFQAGLIAEAAGSELVPGPWLEHLWAIEMLLDVPDTKDGQWESFIQAHQLATIFFPPLGEASELWYSHEEQRLRGQISRFSFVEHTDLWLVAVPNSDAVDILEISPDLPGITLSTVSSMDPLWRGAFVRFDQVKAKLLTILSFEQYENLLANGSDLVSMAMYGAAQRVLDMTVDYLKTRQQFGRTIGSFQALKHKVSDLFIELEHAGSLVYAAAGSDDRAMQRRWSHMAAIEMGRVYRHAAESAIQLHGGIGFTTSLPLHYFLKNAWTSGWRAGSESYHQKWLMKEFGLDYGDTAQERPTAFKSS